MNKRIIAIFALLLFVLNGYGQLSWNVKAGMNMSKITGYGDKNMKPGYQFGIGMDYYFTKHWGIQPSLMIISKGDKNRGVFIHNDYPIPSADGTGYGGYGGYGGYYGYYQPNATFNSTQNRMYLEMPLMLAYRFNLSRTMKFVINGGGYISYGVGGKWKNEITLIYFDDSFDYGSLLENPTMRMDGSSFSERTHKFDAGLGAGTSMEFKNRYILSLFGEWGLKNSYKSIYPQSSMRERNQTYGLSLGYKF